MKRRLFTILSALSLLLFVAVVVLWVRSYCLGDFGEFVGLLESRHNKTNEAVWYSGIYSSHGRLGFGLTQFDVVPGDPNRHHYAEGSVSYGAPGTVGSGIPSRDGQRRPGRGPALTCG